MFNWLRRNGGKSSRRRNYSINELARKNNQWIFQPVQQSELIRRSIGEARSAARQLERQNDHVRKFLNMVVTNTQTIKFQNKAKNADGSLDVPANTAIEESWYEWCELGNCTPCGRLSWDDVNRLLVRSLARDGEFLLRLVPGWPENKWRFAVQPLDVALLDENFNRQATEMQNAVRMGVEIDQWERPIRYHLLKELQRGGPQSQHQTIPANQIIHGYMEDIPGQGRGITFLCTAAQKLHHLHGYEEAEVIGARAAACKMGFFQKDAPDGYDPRNEEDEQKKPIMESAPATWEELPMGWKVQDYDPSHPNTEFEQFEKGMLRSIANGLCVAYNSFANDLENVNFSSIRDGSLKEQDVWKMLQAFKHSHLSRIVYASWLQTCLLAEAITTARGRPLPYSKLEKFNKPEFTGKRWPWVRPLEEGKAKELAVKRGWEADSDIAAERGNDFVDVQRRKERDSEARHVDEIDQEGQ